MNLLSAPVFSVGNGPRATLPGLLATMARGEAADLVRLRPHQRPAWHMFLVQLAALALDHGGKDGPPDSDDAWCDLLRGLTAEHPDDAAWMLIGDDAEKPAFLQPPDPGGLKWTPVETADALDMTITARNHDLKQTIAWGGEAEDWVFALVSLQTMEGYGGAGNNGIARMNGGSSSRPMLGLCPMEPGGAIDPSAWWWRDVRRLLAARKAGHDPVVGTPRGPALIWCLPWPEGHALPAPDLDPWFIEICRRVRLVDGPGGISAKRATSKGARIDGKPFNGVLGDPWCPVTADGTKALTLGGGRFDYKKLHELMGPDWRLPLLAQPRDEGDMLLIAEAFSRGNSKTEGFRSRVLPVPGDIQSWFRTDTVGVISRSQIDDVAKADAALRNGLAVMAASGDGGDLMKEHYAQSRPARADFDAAVDAIFFDHLWAQLRVAEKGEEERFAVRQAFHVALKALARRAFDDGLRGIVCASLFRPRAEARATRMFERRLFKAFGAPAKEETADV